MKTSTFIPNGVYPLPEVRDVYDWARFFLEWSNFLLEELKKQSETLEETLKTGNTFHSLMVSNGAGNHYQRMVWENVLFPKGWNKDTPLSEIWKPEVSHFSGQTVVVVMTLKGELYKCIARYNNKGVHERDGKDEVHYSSYTEITPLTEEVLAHLFNTYKNEKSTLQATAEMALKQLKKFLVGRIIDAKTRVFSNEMVELKRVLMGEEKKPVLV